MDTLYTILYSLTVGSYLFTAWVFRYFSTRIERVLKNHIHALEQRLAELEKNR